MKRLRGYDRAVASQAAQLFHGTDRSPVVPQSPLLKNASPATRAGFQAYFDAWRRTQIAGVKEPR